MKTSELLSKLEALSKEIPFDAEIVTGDDWMPSALISVHHNPPHTYLEFDWPEEEGPEVQDSVEVPNPEHQAQLQVMLNAYLENQAGLCAEGKIPSKVLAEKLLSLVNHALAFGEYDLGAFLQQQSKS